MNGKNKTKNTFIRLVICSVICVFLTAAPAMAVYALPAEARDVIHQLLDDAVRISGVPGISVAVIYDNQTHFFNAGRTSRRNRDNPVSVNAQTLYEIGSLSKAFTAAGILLLEEQRLLSTADYIADHLPWFYVMYQNEITDVTIKQLLNHTSGLTQTHSDAPRGEGTDMLRRTVEPFVGARLDFLPGTAFSYGNANYNILGLIIETVSGQSYESFMQEQVFRPLGLYQTFAYRSDAIATGRMAQGHRHGFFMTFTFDAPVYGGMTPTGFIISSTLDMARWMGIHLGLVQDIPEIFIRVVERAHQADINGPDMSSGTFYTSGWVTNLDTNTLGHAGQTPNFSSNIRILPDEGQGVIFLTNGVNINFDLAWNIHAVLNGDLSQSYTRGEEHRTDIRMSVIVIFLVATTVVELIAGIRNRLKFKPVLTKSKVIMTSFWTVIAVLAIGRILHYPTAVGSGWAYIFDWNPISVTALLFIAPVFIAVTAWHTYTKNPTPDEAEVGPVNSAEH